MDILWNFTNFMLLLRCDLKTWQESYRRRFLIHGYDHYTSVVGTYLQTFPQLNVTATNTITHTHTGQIWTNTSAIQLYGILCISNCVPTARSDTKIPIMGL